MLAAAAAIVVAVAVVWTSRKPAAPSVASLTAARAPGELAWPVPDGKRTAVVEVLNGTGRAGLARAATRLLRSQGIVVVNYGNTDSVAQTTLLVRRGVRDRARVVARALGAGQIREAPDSLRGVDVTVLLGHDFNEPMPLHP